MQQKTKSTLKWTAVGGLLIVAYVFLLKPVVYLILTAMGDNESRPQISEGHTNDASRLNETEVSEVYEIPLNTEDPESQFAELLMMATNEGLKVSIAGAQHSMGGHTMYPGGIVINMLSWNSMELDESRNLLHVQSGALWSQILPYLDSMGKSIIVMQSNNSFSVGGSISVNCHGWQFGSPPIASTVESFRLMKANGEIVTCSRAENTELFTLTLGGYGLFGIILDVELRVTDNARLLLEQNVIATDALIDSLLGRAKGNAKLQMAFGRINVDPDNFLEESILSSFTLDSGDIPELSKNTYPDLRRLVFRGTEGSDYGKKLRWTAESTLRPVLGGDVYSRNQLLNEGVEVFENRSGATTDILHEYFVPYAEFNAFIQRLQQIIPESGQDLLNITVRFVEVDTDTYLRYADEKMVALVMLFTQEISDEGESAMKSMTRELIDAVIECKGRYYLPYRLHATTQQFLACYPQSRDFFKLKRKYDPKELFQNKFYTTYSTTETGAQ